MHRTKSLILLLIQVQIAFPRDYANVCSEVVEKNIKSVTFTKKRIYYFKGRLLFIYVLQNSCERNMFTKEGKKKLL